MQLQQGLVKGFAARFLHEPLAQVAHHRRHQGGIGQLGQGAQLVSLWTEPHAEASLEPQQLGFPALQQAVKPLLAADAQLTVQLEQQQIGAHPAPQQRFDLVLQRREVAITAEGDLQRMPAHRATGLGRDPGRAPRVSPTTST